MIQKDKRYLSGKKSILDCWRWFRKQFPQPRLTAAFCKPASSARSVSRCPASPASRRTSSGPSRSPSSFGRSRRPSAGSGGWWWRRGPLGWRRTWSRGPRRRPGRRGTWWSRAERRWRRWWWRGSGSFPGSEVSGSSAILDRWKGHLNERKNNYLFYGWPKVSVRKT